MESAWEQILKGWKDRTINLTYSAEVIGIKRPK